MPLKDNASIEITAFRSVPQDAQALNDQLAAFAANQPQAEGAAA